MQRRGVQTFTADYKGIMQSLVRRQSGEARRWSVLRSINPFGISITSAVTEVAQEGKADSQRYRSSFPRCGSVRGY